MEYLWDSSRVNAFASRDGESWSVKMHGGLARRSEITPDGLALVVCHELGHLFGGYPFFQYDKLSFEGQADTFATQVCLKELWSAQHATNAERASELSPKERALCSTSVQQGDAERDLCGRLLRAGISVGRLFAALESSKDPSVLTPSSKVVQETSSSHPPAQCRLDTYLQGARCGVKKDLREIPGFDSADEAEQKTAMRRTSCALSGLQPEYARPACWFKDE